MSDINVVIDFDQVVVVEVIEQGPPGVRGYPGIKGDKGDPGVYDGQVAPADPDPVLLFENALV
ncbi:hypothetical protein LIN78_12105 [Leeia sp. TBRC 13508]|uniref:Uncharacterized protein n=1 Tax=Leeia speluncae TaxID=2884804 RepID=A0ABS8D8E5_9NEIS|nr:hypothetical protein [Leeia speluncae]MCB6184288.1 hypothetical protein [Leeia speluncae]